MSRSRRSQGPTVLVAPSDFRAGPWACRSLASGGYRVVGAHTEGRGTGGRSLACPRPRRYPSPLGDPEGFVERVRELVREESVAAILPASEDVVRVLADHHDSLGAVLVSPDRDQYRRLCDKAELGATAIAAGVGHPVTAAVGPQGADGPLPPLPCVVKPRVSGEDMHGVAVALTVRTEAERDAAVGALLEEGRDALVQELLDGPRWFGHSVGLGDDFRFLAFRALADYPRGSGPASFLRTDAIPDGMAESTRRLVEAVGYAGPCSLSFIESHGRLLVHDVNLRLGATVGASIRSGLDLPRLAVDIALGRHEPVTPLPTRTITYVRLDGELGSAVSALRGRGTGESARELFGRVAKGLVAPGWMLDPSPLDPYFLATLATRQLLGMARGVKHGLERAGS